MTQTDNPLSDTHEQVEALLPWYVKGQLDGGDLAMVETHLQQCEICQQEIKAERHLAPEIRSAVMAAPSHVPSSQWQNFKQRIESQESEAAQPGMRPPRRQIPTKKHPSHRSRSFWNRPEKLRWVALAQAAVIVAMVGVAMPGLLSEPEKEYQTLSSASSAPERIGNIVVKFQPDATEAELRGALADAGVRLVDGPMETDAYLVYVTDAQKSHALNILRGKSVIALAEPIDAAEEP